LRPGRSRAWWGRGRRRRWRRRVGEEEARSLEAIAHQRLDLREPAHQRIIPLTSRSSNCSAKKNKENNSGCWRLATGFWQLRRLLRCRGALDMPWGILEYLFYFSKRPLMDTELDIQLVCLKPSAVRPEINTPLLASFIIHCQFHMAPGR